MKRLFVSLALIGLLLPTFRSVAVVAHLLLEHDHAGTPAAAVELETALHGHDHESGTPSHDHPFTLQASSAPVRLAAPALATSLAAAPAGPIGPTLLRRTAALEAPARASSAGPTAPESLSVFRI